MNIDSGQNPILARQKLADNYIASQLEAEGRNHLTDPELTKTGEILSSHATILLKKQANLEQGHATKATIADWLREHPNELSAIREKSGPEILALAKQENCVEIISLFS